MAGFRFKNQLSSGKFEGLAISKLVPLHYNMQFLYVFQGFSRDFMAYRLAGVLALKILFLLRPVVEIELVTQRIVLEFRGLGTADSFAVRLDLANKLFPSRPAATAASGIVDNGFREFSGSSDAVRPLAPPVLIIAVHRIYPGVRSRDLLTQRGPKE